jgi:hypothetical protein
MFSVSKELKGRRKKKVKFCSGENKEEDENGKKAKNSKSK